LQKSFQVNDPMANALSLVPGNPEPIQEALRCVVGFLGRLDFVFPGSGTCRR
jgi:hypothetical protein